MEAELERYRVYPAEAPLRCQFHIARPSVVCAEQFVHSTSLRFRVSSRTSIDCRLPFVAARTPTSNRVDATHSGNPSGCVVDSARCGGTPTPSDLAGRKRLARSDRQQNPVPQQILSDRRMRRPGRGGGELRRAGASLESARARSGNSQSAARSDVHGAARRRAGRV